MSDTKSPSAVGLKKRWDRRAIVTLMTVVALGGWLIYKVRSNPDSHHKRTLHRIDQHLERAYGAFFRPGGFLKEPLAQADRGRYMIIGAVRTAMANRPFYHKEDVIPEKLEAIADRLDATNGADLQTFEGCTRLLVRCDEASWTFYDYPPITLLHDEEATRDIPKLPELGKRWENDPRTKKSETQ